MNSFLTASSSINAFLDFLYSHNSEFVGKDFNMTWVTKDEALLNNINANFNELNDILGITNSKNIIQNPNSDITISNLPPNNMSEVINAHSVYIGGLSALWACYFATKKIKNDKKLYEKYKDNMPLYIVYPDLQNMTAYSSSLQFHVSHAAPMYADPSFSTLNIIYKTIIRNLWRKFDTGAKISYLIAEIYLPNLLNKSVLKVGIKYFINEVKYKISKLFNLETILDETIPMAINSGNIMDEEGETLQKKLLHRTGSFKLAYNKAETDEMEKWARELKKYSVDIEKVSQEFLSKKSGINTKCDKLGSIWFVKSDGFVSPKLQHSLIEAITAKNGQIIKGIATEVHYDDNYHVAGVTLKEQNKFINTNNVYSSIGVKSTYRFQKKFPFNKLLKQPDDEIAGSGYSAYLLVFAKINNPINANNNHFTPIATATDQDGNEITLIKATCGGLIGSRKFSIQCAINNLYYAKEVIFHDKRVEIISAKTCSRSLNSFNSEKLLKILPGFHIAQGFGGKGVTDAPSFAKLYIQNILFNNKN